MLKLRNYSLLLNQKKLEMSIRTLPKNL